MKSLITIAIAVAALTVISLTPRTDAATAPWTAERKHEQAKEAFQLEVTKVYLEETEGNFKDVLMEATVTKVVRSACGVKNGDKIVIKSRRRYMTNEQLSKSEEGFKEAPLVIKKGWTGTAYLQAENTTDSVRRFGLILEGFSFVQ